MGALGLVQDDEARGLFRVHRRAFTDPAVFERERAAVFSRGWLFVGHASELPRPGDYRTRSLAGRPIIFARDEAGGLRVLFNTCPHRGALVCRERHGNAKVFQCSYHGWSFDTRGALIGVPGEEAYAEAFKRADHGLHAPARVEEYRGFVFATVDATSPDLVTYLAGATEYIDLICDQSTQGLETLRGEHAYSMRANWKLLVENSTDIYHVPTTHRRFIEYVTDTGGGGRPRRTGIGRALGNGHAAVENPPTAGRPIADWHPEFGEAKKEVIEGVQRDLERRFGPEKAFKMTRMNRNLFIFPNLIIIDAASITVRTFFPTAPDHTEILSWALAPAEETPADRAIRLKNYLLFLGPAGFGTPDDTDMLESCQRGFGASEVEWNDVSRGAKRAQPLHTDELQHRAFWRGWRDRMAEPEGT